MAALGTRLVAVSDDNAGLASKTKHCEAGLLEPDYLTVVSIALA